MKVKELIEKLSDCDPDAEVLLMTQENWPFENEVEGVTERSDFTDKIPDGGEKNDVFLVEGTQVRYGSKKAWESAS